MQVLAASGTHEHRGLSGGGGAHSVSDESLDARLTKDDVTL